MSLTNPNKVITEERLSEFYGQILPYLGGMPDLLANKFNKSDLYSTDEKMIGCWIDGKPLYQRAFTFTQVNGNGNAWITTNFNLGSGLEKVIYGCAISDSNTPYPVVATWDGSYNFRFMHFRNTSVAFIGGIICYTKTADSTVAIGNDTDYSTTEKIIGTWIDGKPIYQKTISGTGSADISLGTDVNLGIDLRGFFVETSGSSSTGTVNCIPIYFSDTGSSNISAYFRKQNGTNETVIRFANSSAYTNLPYYVTIQYTKTTD